MELLHQKQPGLSIALLQLINYLSVYRGTRVSRVLRVPLELIKVRISTER